MTTDQTTETLAESNFTDAADSDSITAASLEIVSINKSSLFTAQDCNDILSTCVEELWLPTTVIGNKKIHVGKRQKLRGDTAGFPFLNIRDVTKAANTNIYDFSLLGIIDQDFPQVFKYSQGDFYDMHIDINSMAVSRKITFLINLSDSSEYEGGQIEFLNIDVDPQVINEQGSCLVFPSYVPYRITPVTKGTMHLLVGHVHGALFK
jgi:predicted 2-oxoglutarate/Fe(II)-dependent dioxygenase YbiX